VSKIALTLMLLLGVAGFLPASGPPLPARLAAGAAQVPGPGPQPRLAQVEHRLEQAVARVQPLLHRYGYAAVFLTVMVEGVGIIAPGQTLLIAAALAASQGNLSIVWVLIWAGLAAWLGNSLGYLLGRWGGQALLAKLRVRGDRLARLEAYFSRYGQGVILIARFFDGLRQLNGIVAGMLEMPWGVFTTVNILGAVLWTGVWGLGAYMLGRGISTYHETFRQVGPWVAALTLIAILALLVYLWRCRQVAKPD